MLLSIFLGHACFQPGASGEQFSQHTHCSGIGVRKSPHEERKNMIKSKDTWCLWSTSLQGQVTKVHLLRQDLFPEKDIATETIQKWALQSLS